VGRESLVDLELEVGLAPVQPEVGQGPVFRIARAMNEGQFPRPLPAFTSHK
jgi:hypothetical protein